MIEPENKTNGIQIPVLIVGGGITGLSAALFLQQQGVGFLLVERHPRTAIQPKARTIDVRAMELFRELGLSDTLRESGKAMAPSWGILQGPNLVDALTNRTTAARVLGHPDQLVDSQQWAAQSPESVCRCTQDISEAVLLATAVARGADLRFNHEMVHVSQTEQQVMATIRHRQTGQALSVVADYMIAADGANSPIRQSLNATMSGAGTLAYFLNIYFEADLADLVRGREFSQFLVREPQVTGFLLSINNNDRWAFHLKFEPAKGESLTDYPESLLVALLKRLIGLPDLSIRILSVLPWPLAVRIADEMQFGRIFLAGDAAHTMTPYAGKGANAGVQDVHNLTWKLKAVLADGVDQQLLATYQHERQPVGAFYARLSGAMAAPDGLVNDQKMVSQGADLIGLPNYVYTSKAIVGGPAANQQVRYFTGQPGTRLPHRWLDETRQHSTLDWVQGRFILVASGKATGWTERARQWANTTGLLLPVYGFDRQADAQSWQTLTSTRPGDALLVRPDGFVAAHLPSTTGVSEGLQLLQTLGTKS